jgi:hypothetical protein
MIGTQRIGINPLVKKWKSIRLFGLLFYLAWWVNWILSGINLNLYYDFFIYYSNWIESDESEQILSLQRILMWTCRLKSWVTHYNCAVKVINQTSLIKEALILARKKKRCLDFTMAASIRTARICTDERMCCLWCSGSVYEPCNMALCYCPSKSSDTTLATSIHVAAQWCA